MNYLNITKYIYLIVGIAMIGFAVYNWNQEPKPWLILALAALAIFTFFFRSKFAKKFEQRNAQNNQNKS